MRIAAEVILSVFLLQIFTHLYARETAEQYLMQLKNPTVEDYVDLIYKSSHQNKLYAIEKLLEMEARGEMVIDALVFGLQQGTRIVDRLYGRVINDFGDVRAASAKALGEIADPRVLPELYIALKYDHDTHVRSSAALAIGKIGNKESIQHLRRAIATSNSAGSDDRLILACVEAIGIIGNREGLLLLIEIIRGDYTRTIKLAARDALKKIEW